MEIEAWVQLIDVLEKHLAALKKASSADLKVYSLYLLVMVAGVKLDIETAKPSKVLFALLTLLFSTLAYSLMLDEKESNYYIILTMFYVKAIFFYSRVNLNTSIACAIMALFHFAMSREAAYYEVYKSSFSDVLHDSYWMVIFLLHCIVCCSFFSRHEYKRAYLGLRSCLRVS